MNYRKPEVTVLGSANTLIGLIDGKPFVTMVDLPPFDISMPGPAYDLDE